MKFRNGVHGFKDSCLLVRRTPSSSLEGSLSGVSIFIFTLDPRGTSSKEWNDPFPLRKSTKRDSVSCPLFEIMLFSRL